MNETPEFARRAAEAAARESYGRLLAFLASRARNISACEDALADAFRAALETWPARGVPARPAAWLLTAARRNLLHGYRHDKVREAAAPTLALLGGEEGHDPMQVDAIPDERLKLMFVCAHPAIDAAARTPLMLQTVLGLDAARIASAFLVSPATMSQRLVRAKAKIRDAGIAFAVPGQEELAGRLDAVLAAIYAAYSRGLDELPGADSDRAGLAAEAVWLGRVLAQLMPQEPEALGLLALMLHCEARRAARRDGAGAFVPLDRQPTDRWDRTMTAEAEALLARAAAFARMGRYQIEAAIQSVHAQRAVTGRTEWAALDLLYGALGTLAPSTGAAVSHAAVRARTAGPSAGLALLDALSPEIVAAYQPYWVVRGHLLAEAGSADASRDAYARAIGLTEDPALRAFLVAKTL